MPLVWSPRAIPEQSGRLAVVTGANAGLGRQVAARLAARGARVVLACRDTAKGEAAAAGIRERTPGAELEVRRLDLADLASVAAFAEGLAADHDRLDLLANNAGLMAIDEARTADGFEMQLGVNHLGAVALTLRLLPLMRGVAGSRVCAHSSMGHWPGQVDLDDLQFERRRYERWQAYFDSKLANLLFTRELERRLRAAGAETIAVAAHPGGSSTDLGHEGSSAANAVFRAASWAYTQPAWLGAHPMLRALTDPRARGDAYYGPVGVMVGPAIRAPRSPSARDARLAHGLWERSCELVGVGPELPRP